MEAAVQISEILTEPMVVPNLGAGNKEDALRRLAEHVCEHDSVQATSEHIFTVLSNRERLGSTGVGESVAIPHAKVAGLDHLVACFARVPEGVDFDAIDQHPVKLIFALLVPENSAGTHLKALARISRLLRNPDFRAGLLECTDRTALFNAFLDEDAKY